MGILEVIFLIFIFNMNFLYNNIGLSSNDDINLNLIFLTTVI